MDKITEEKYISFKENPLGFFKESIDTLSNSDNAVLRSSSVLLIGVKTHVINAYIQALYDNNLITECEYNKMVENTPTIENTWYGK